MTISQIIDLNWDFGDPAGSYEQFRNLADQHPEGQGRLLTQAARCWGLQGEFEKAQELLDSIEADDREGPELAVRLALENGRVKNSSGNRAAALPYFEQALKIGKDAGLDMLAIDAAHMLGIASSPEGSIKWGHKAIEMVDQSDDPETFRWLGPILNNLAWTLHDKGDYAEALKHFERAVEVRKELEQERPTQIGIWSVGRCLRSLGRLDEALTLQLNLKAEMDSKDQKDGFVYEEIGECLLALGRTAESKPHFAQAYQLLSQIDWLVKSDPERLKRIDKLSKI